MTVNGVNKGPHWLDTVVSLVFVWVFFVVLDAATVSRAVAGDPDDDTKAAPKRSLRSPGSSEYLQRASVERKKGFRGAMSAELIWDGGDSVAIPSSMLPPRSDQMTGTAAERLAELAGRTCYESMGKGRSSDDYHKHILGVKHLNVHQHWHVTVSVNADDDRELVSWMVNRPGVYVHLDDDGACPRLTFSPRCLIEWERYGPDFCKGGQNDIGRDLRVLIQPAAPRLLSEQGRVTRNDYFVVSAPAHPREQWVSLYVRASRGTVQELLRHSYDAAPSMRSTRYCDEGETPHLVPPLLNASWDWQAEIPQPLKNGTLGYVGNVSDAARQAYAAVYEALYGWLVHKGVSKSTARKQAREAAREYLPLALETQLVFSASVWEWKNIIEMRCTNEAGAGIRVLTNEAHSALLTSRYSGAFQGYEFVPAEDGIGKVLKK